jgi:hypothetical protein
MVIIEGTLGDSATKVPWYQILAERVFVGEEVLFRSYGYRVLLRGFQVTYAGTDRHLQEVRVRLEEYTSVANPGYINLEASLKLRDEEPGARSLFGYELSGDEKVSISVDYTILLW